MDDVEINNRGAAKPENGSDAARTEFAGDVGNVELKANEPADDERAAKPSFFDTLRRNFERASRAQHGSTKERQSRQELRKDKTRTLLALGGFTLMMILMFVLVFSSPPKPKQLNNRPPGTPDLGQRVTPGQGGPQANVTPLMNATPPTNGTGNNGLATPQDVAQTAKPEQPSSTSQNVSSEAASGQHTLGEIDFQNKALQQQYAMGGTNPPPSSIAPAPATKTDELKTPSLVFVRAQEQVAGTRMVEPVVEANRMMDSLPVGTHLVARLEAPVSTALQAPVVAVIEYNYEQDGQIILPAGTQVIGKLRGATPEGYVSLDFDELEFQDGATQKIDATAMGLDYRPLKGHVTGRNRGLRFLVQSLTGVGEVAAYMVGGSPGSTSVFSEDALLREQLAANMAMAGQQQFNQLAMTQHIVVTVPGNKRFYLVLEQGASPEITPASLRPASHPSALPSEQELMELMELKRELAAATQTAADASAQPAAASRP